MFRKHLLAASCMLVCAASIWAQTAQPSDPLSGMWGRRDGAGLDLKFDGRSAVTGTLYITSVGAVPIASGTFDPRTRKLRVEGHAKGPDGRTAPFAIEGTLDNDTLNLSYTFGENAGKASFTREVTAAAAPPAVNAAAALRKSFGDVSGWVTQAAALVPADKYDYRPAPTVRTFAQLVGHIADSHNYSCAQAAGRDVQWADHIEKGPGDKATIVAKLKTATDGCAAAYANGTNMPALVEAVGHTNLHYGNLVTYMRMLGLTPPSS